MILCVLLAPLEAAIRLLRKRPKLYGMLLLALLTGCATFVVSAGCSSQPVIKEEVEEIPPSPEIENKYVEAEGLAKQGDYSAALEIVKPYIYTAQNPQQREQVTLLAAECLLQMHYYEDAHNLYTKYLGEFAATSHFDEVVEHELEIGFKFVAGAKRSLWGLYILPAKDYGMKIVRDTLTRYPYAKSSEAYHLKLAENLFQNGYYDDSRTEYESFGNVYSQSASVPQTRLRVAICHLKEYQGGGYEITPLLDARRAVDDFLAKYKTDVLLPDAQKLSLEIIELMAERDYDTACFYHKTNKPKSARIYFQRVIDNYPQTGWAQKAQERILALPPIEEKQPESTPAAPPSAPGHGH